MVMRRHKVVSLACLAALCSLMIVEAQDSTRAEKKKSGEEKVGSSTDPEFGHRKKKESLGANQAMPDITVEKPSSISTPPSAEVKSSPNPPPSPQTPPPQTRPQAPTPPTPPTPAPTPAPTPNQQPVSSQVKGGGRSSTLPPQKPPVLQKSPPVGAPKQLLSLRRALDTVAPSVKIPTPAGVDLVKQLDYVLEAVPSLSAILLFNFALKGLLRNVLGIKTFPPPLVGMAAFFFTMVNMDSSNAEAVFSFLKPGVALLTNFLALFFLPGLVVTPLAIVREQVRALDFLKFCLIIFSGMAAILAQTSFLVEFLMKITKAEIPRRLPPTKGKFEPFFSASLEIILGSLTAVTGVAALMAPALQQAFYGFATAFAFIFASRLPRFIPPHINKFWHPLITAYLTTTAIFIAQGQVRGKGLIDTLRDYLVPGATWDKAAGNLIMFWLEPAIISFGFGLYERRVYLFQNQISILAGAMSSAFFGILTIASIGRVFGVPRVLALALMPRGTAALAVVQAGTISASTALTVVHCCLIGMLGANFGGPLLDFMGILNPVARGIATGGSGLALSAAVLAQVDPAAFPFGTLTMSLTSTFATILWNIPSFQNLVFWIAGMPRYLPSLAAGETVFEQIVKTGNPFLGWTDAHKQITGQAGAIFTNIKKSLSGNLEKIQRELSHPNLGGNVGGLAARLLQGGVNNLKKVRDALSFFKKH